MNTRHRRWTASFNCTISSGREISGGFAISPSGCALGHLSNPREGIGDAPCGDGGEDCGENHAHERHEAEAEPQQPAPVPQRALDLAQRAERLMDAGHRSLQDDEPAEAGEALGRRGIGVAPAGAGVAREPLFIARKAGAFRPECVAYRWIALLAQVGAGIHDALPGVARACLGDEDAAPGGDLYASAGDGLCGSIRDLLHGLDRQHRLHDPQGLFRIGIVDADRDVDGPDPRGIVVLDLAHRQLMTPGALPPLLVGLDEVARRVGERDVEPVAIGEEDLGEVGRRGDLLAQVRARLGKGVETLADAKAGFDLIDRSAGEALGGVRRVRSARGLDHDAGRRPCLGLHDASDEELVELVGGVARLGSQIRSGDLVGQRVAASSEARSDDVELVGEIEEGDGARNDDGEHDTRQGVHDELCAQAAAVAFRDVHFQFPVPR